MDDSVFILVFSGVLEVQTIRMSTDAKFVVNFLLLNVRTLSSSIDCNELITLNLKVLSVSPQFCHPDVRPGGWSQNTTADR